MDQSERIKERRKNMGTRGPKPGDGGRPKKIDIDIKAFETIIQLPIETKIMCDALGVHRATLDRWCVLNYKKTFAQLQDQNRGLFNRNIIGKQYELAMKGNTRMLKHLGENYCGQSQKIDNTVTTTATISADVKVVEYKTNLSDLPNEPDSQAEPL